MAELAKDTGAYLTSGLERLAVKHPDYIDSIRGKGTYLAFDCDSAETRNALIAQMKAFGVNQGGCGVRSVRLRPSLYFEKKHADIYLDALDKAI